MEKGTIIKHCVLLCVASLMLISCIPTPTVYKPVGRTQYYVDLYGNYTASLISNMTGSAITGLGITGFIPYWSNSTNLLSTSASYAAGTFDFNGSKITDVADPTNNQDAATKLYVDSHAGTGTVSGTGSTNRLAYWSNTTNISDSNIYFDIPNGRYGIATLTPERTLHVHDGGGSPQLQLSYTTGSLYTDLWANALGKFIILPSANQTGISTSVPTETLTVGGNISMDSGYYVKTGTNDLHVNTGTAKTLVLDTPVYDDLMIQAANIRQPASSSPTWTAYKSTEVPAFSKSATNVLYFSAQLPHRYKVGSNIEFHMHLAYPDSGAGTSTWYFTYSWANMGDTFPVPTGHTVNITSPATTDYHQNAQVLTPLTQNTTKNISSVLLCSISRLGGATSDDYNNVIYLTSCDFHYQIDTMGSRQEIAK